MEYLRLSFGGLKRFTGRRIGVALRKYSLGGYIEVFLSIAGTTTTATFDCV